MKVKKLTLRKDIKKQKNINNKEGDKLSEKMKIRMELK